MNGIDLIEQVIEQPRRYQKRHRESVYQEFRAFKRAHFIGPKNPLIIGFGYKKRSGKDTAANFLAKNYGAYKMAFADPIKVAAMITYGLDKSQVYGNRKSEDDEFWGVSPRELLQCEGTELHRNALAELFPKTFGNKDIWIRNFKRRVEQVKRDFFAVCDLRYANEAHAIQGMGGVVIKVDASKRISSNQDTHESENSLDGFTGWDYILDNNKSLEHFYQGINTIIQDLPNTFSK